MLIFTPELCPAGRDPLAVVEHALPHLDVIQVRIKDPELGTAPARATCDWTRRVLALVARAGSDALVLVDDRVDVAAALAAEGLDGVHLGADDAPGELARALLGPEALVGLSTHGAADVARSEELPVDYLGFGPVHATATKGYARGLGSEAAWIASRATARPLFPIGGIEAANAAELAPVGRAAVGRALLSAPDPPRAAREIAALLASA
jgi:thiamine-phosphate pyrophosphorylase